MSDSWDDYIPAPIEVFHGETMKAFHQGAQFPANETFVNGIRYVNGIEFNRLLAEFKTKIMKEYGITSAPTRKKPELIKVDLGHNASRHYKETLFERHPEIPVEGFSQLVTCADRCGGRVTVRGRRVEPRHVENFTDEEIRETWDLSDEQIAECRKFLDSRRSGAV